MLPYSEGKRFLCRSPAGLFAAACVTALASCGGSGSSPGAPQNQSPRVASPNADLTVVERRPFSYDAGKSGAAFSDPDGDPLSISVSFNPIPDWASVSGTRISGTPPAAGSYLVSVLARDPSGNSIRDDFWLTVRENAAPELNAPIGYQFFDVGEFVSVDLLAGSNTVFVDPDDLEQDLSYSIDILAPDHGFTAIGTIITGRFQGFGAVRAVITATDPSGDTASDTAGIVAAAALDNAPILPAQPFSYADAEIGLPRLFLGSELDPALGLRFGDTVPPDNVTTNAGASLGRVLFYDKRLSVTNTASCGSCHFQANSFAAPEKFSAGFQGELTKRNAMALANVRLSWHDQFFFDMRVSTLESLARMPIEDPTELGQPFALLIGELKATPFYPSLFDAAFGTPEITEDRVSKALAQFMRSLVSFHSRYDEAFHLDESNPARRFEVLTEEELWGEQVFKSNKCVSCHGSDMHEQKASGPHNTGLDLSPADPGVVLNGLQPGAFRVPSLRNIAVTAPYMHDGRFTTLREVIDHYDSGVQPTPGLSQALQVSGTTGTPLRLNLTEFDKQALEAYLRTLTDEQFLTDPRFADPFP